MSRVIRYQGAIINDHRILLIRHTEHASGRSYWVIPGGGIEAGESEETCVQREILEETSLHVEVERLLLDEAGVPNGVYQRIKTYLCRIIDGEAQPGHEPEEEASQEYMIDQVGWFDLRDSNQWNPLVRENLITYSLLQRIQRALGYTTESWVNLFTLRRMCIFRTLSFDCAPRLALVAPLTSSRYPSGGRSSR